MTAHLKVITTAQLDLDTVMKVYNHNIDCVEPITAILLSCWRYHNESLADGGKPCIPYDLYEKFVTYGDIIRLLKSRAVVVKGYEDLKEVLGYVKTYFRPHNVE